MPSSAARDRWFSLALIGVLVAYALVAYGHAFGLAFVNDDYLFLEKVRERSFWRLWLPEELIFHWYRPLSREVHYWVLNRLAGLHEPAFHAVSFALAVTVLFLYFRLTERLVGRAAAGVATAAVASLGLWSTPILWVAGAQDLWMLLFALMFLDAVVSGRMLVAGMALALALLSKETAGILPIVAFAAVWLLQGQHPRVAIARTWAFWLMTVIWAIAHPTLRLRLAGSFRQSIEEERPSALIVAAKTLLAQANLETRFAPEIGWPSVLLKGLAGGMILCLLVWLSFRTAPRGATVGRRPAPERVIAFGLCWAVSGFAVLFLPSIGWHAYYGVLGSLGFWLAVGCLLARRPRLAASAVMALALAREARGATPSWDWGTDWYQSRAGTMLSLIRERLMAFHPSLPPHSRLYFARLPNNIGLLAGDGPAFRIWYGDQTLSARYYSAYVPRARGDEGPDYFFRFDTVRVLVEIKPGDEPLPVAMRLNPDWQHDHEVLAALFARTGDFSGAAAEYAKLARAVPGRPDFAIYAGAAHEVRGQPDSATAFYHMASLVYGDSVVRQRAADLVRAAPIPAQ